MMKAKDCAVATALVLNGYLRSNVDNGEEAKPNENQHLADAIRAIRGECSDWAENLASDDGNALEPDALSIDVLELNGAPASRTPYNLVSAAVALSREAFDLAGPGAIADLLARVQANPAGDTLAKRGKRGAVDGPELLIEAANEMAAEIDASTDRPDTKLAAFQTITTLLRSQGVSVEDRVTAPANW